MEGSGTVGIMKARQARRVREGHGRVWKVPYWIDQVRQARSDAAMNAMLRKDKAGEERLGEVGCGLQRQDAAGGERCDQERKGRAELGQAWQVWRGRWAW